MVEFDQYSDRYEETLEQSLAGLGSIDSALASKVQLLRYLFRLNRIDMVSTMLDFGTGKGLLAAQLHRFAKTVIGLDVSFDSLKCSMSRSALRVNYGGIRIPFRDGCIDFAVASCVFHHIAAMNRPEILKELHRVLTPGGLLLIIEHNPWNPLTRWIVNRCEFDQDAELLPLSNSVTLLRSAGFESVAGNYFFAVPPTNRALWQLDRALSRFPLGAQYWSLGRRTSHAPCPKP